VTLEVSRVSQYRPHRRFPNWLMLVLAIVLGAIFSLTFWQYIEAKNALIEKQKQDQPVRP
jgi:hypothetical protein